MFVGIYYSWGSKSSGFVSYVLLASCKTHKLFVKVRCPLHTHNVACLACFIASPSSRYSVSWIPPLYWHGGLRSADTNRADILLFRRLLTRSPPDMRPVWPRMIPPPITPPVVPLYRSGTLSSLNATTSVLVGHEPLEGPGFEGELCYLQGRQAGLRSAPGSAPGGAMLCWNVKDVGQG